MERLDVVAVERDGDRRRIADRRALVVAELAALEAGEPLPTPAHVALVQQQLQDSGVEALTGWAYICSDVVAHTRRADLVARNPAGVAGLVVLIDEDLDRAREALVDVAVPGALLVSTAAALLSGDTTGANQFVLQVSQTVLDPEAASIRAEGLIQEAEALEQELGDTLAAYDRARGSADRLARLLGEWPALRVEELRTVAAGRRRLEESKRQALTGLRADHARRSADAETARATRNTYDESHRGAVAASVRAADAARNEDGQFNRLAGAAQQLREQAEGLVLDAEQSRSDAAEAERQRESFQQQGADATRARLTADQRRAELGDVPAETGTDTVPADELDPDVLERRWRQLASDYERQVTDEELAARVRAAEQDLRRVQRELRVVAADVVAHAEQLAADEAVADRDSRHAGHERAREVDGSARAQAEQARARLKRADGTVSEASQVARGRLPDPMPDDVEQAEQARRRSEREAKGRRDEAGKELDTARVEEERARRLEASFKHLRMAVRSFHGTARALDLEQQAAVDDLDRERAAPLDIDLEDPSDVDHAQPAPSGPGGTVGSAVAHLGRLGQQLGEHARARTDTGSRLTAAASASRAVSADDEFVRLQGLRQQLVSAVDDRTLAQRAGEWVRPAEETQASLVTDLARLEQLELEVAEGLSSEVSSAVKLLTAAQLASTLPDEPSLGPWAGQPFLKLSFKALRGDQLVGALVVAVRLAVEKKLQPTGHTLLKHGLAAAVSDLRAEVFCPDGTLTNERHAIGALKFSTGQALTTAVLLYCTVARMRNREHRSFKVGGPLVLDNPIGEANHLTLLELQRTMADQLGVQLVYLSGILQRDVFEGFGAVNRLANDLLDRSTNTQLLRVDHSGPGRVVAAQVFQDLPRNRPLTNRTSDGSGTAR